MAVPPLLPGNMLQPGGECAPDEALPALRSRMRKLRQSLHSERQWAPANVLSVIRDVIQSSRIVGLYFPMSGEPDPVAIIQHHGKTTALPALMPDGQMIFRVWRPGDPLTNAPWSGRQPGSDAEIVEPDLIFVPLLAFDHGLNRLGQGGGHYDRYFAGHGAVMRVGVAWDQQRVASLPVRPWDVPLHAVITDQFCYYEDLHNA